MRKNQANASFNPFDGFEDLLSPVESTKDAKDELTRKLWIQKFVNHEDIDIPAKLNEIWGNDLHTIHVYLAKYDVDKRRAEKGQLVIV